MNDSFSITNWGAVLAGVDLDAGNASGLVEGMNQYPTGAPASGVGAATLVSSIGGILNSIRENTQVFYLKFTFSKSEDRRAVSIELSTDIKRDPDGSVDGHLYFYLLSGCYQSEKWYRSRLGHELSGKIFFPPQLDIKVHIDPSRRERYFTVYLFVGQDGEWYARFKKYAGDFAEIIEFDPIISAFELGPYTGPTNGFDPNRIFTNTMKVDDIIRENVERSLCNARLTMRYI